MREGASDVLRKYPAAAVAVEALAEEAELGRPGMVVRSELAAGWARKVCRRVLPVVAASRILLLFLLAAVEDSETGDCRELVNRRAAAIQLVISWGVVATAEDHRETPVEEWMVVELEEARADPRGPEHAGR